MLSWLTNILPHLCRSVCPQSLGTPQTETMQVVAESRIPFSMPPRPEEGVKLDSG